MADIFLLKPVDLTTTSSTTIYTCPAANDTTVPATDATTAIVKSILVSEDSNNADTITVTITRDSAVFSVFKDKAVGAKGTVELLTNPLVMNTDEELKIQAENANDLHVVCSYLEIT